MGILLFVTPFALAQQSALDILEKKSEVISAENQTKGWGYIISGGITLGLSIPAYYLSQDLFARAAYGVTETLGVASIGYGAYLVLVSNNYTQFKRILDGAGGLASPSLSLPSLSAAERDHLARLFLNENAVRAKESRKIRVITHALTAGLSFLNGFTSSQSELRIGFFFLGGINTLVALSFGFTQSEEEELVGSLTKTELVLGPLIGIRIQF